MNFISRCALVPALLGAAAVRAADPPPPPNLASLPPLVAASAAAPAKPEGAGNSAADLAAASNRAQAIAKVSETKVIEDDKVRIEEKRLRGQTQTVTVHSKQRGVSDYEVIMPPLGKDPSQDKGAAGKRTWSLFDF